MYTRFLSNFWEKISKLLFHHSFNFSVSESKVNLELSVFLLYLLFHGIVNCFYHQQNFIFRERGGTAWVTYKSPDMPSVHSTLKNTGMSETGVPYVVADDGFTISSITRVCMIYKWWHFALFMLHYSQCSNIDFVATGPMI